MNRPMEHMIFGRHPVTVALRDHAGRMERLWVLKSQIRSAPFARMVRDAKTHGISVVAIDKRALDRLSDGATHQGVVARMAMIDRPDFKTWYQGLPQADHGSPSLVIALDQVQDPRNLGAVVRTAAAVPVEGILLPRRGSAPLSPVAMKASAGTLDAIPIVSTVNLANAIRQLKMLGYWITAITQDAEESICDSALPERSVLVFGGEGSGIRPLIRKLSDTERRIPLTGPAGSLNVSSAVAIAVYEYVRIRLQGRVDPGKNS